MSQFLFWWSQSLEFELQVSDSLRRITLTTDLLNFVAANKWFKYLSIFSTYKTLNLIWSHKVRRSHCKKREKYNWLCQVTCILFVLKSGTCCYVWNMYSKKTKKCRRLIHKHAKKSYYQVFLGGRRWTQTETMYCEVWYFF